MNDRWIRLAVAWVVVALTGCASQRGMRASATHMLASSSDAPAQTKPTDERSEAALEQIPPRPVLPAAAIRTDVEPPVEAVQFFARARIAMLDGQVQTSVNLLEKAVAADPNSYELWDTLARLYQGDKSSDERSIAALRQAAALEPDHLGLQLTLGRQYLDRGQSEEGLTHLLLALKTREYSEDGADAAVADYFLAHSLQQQGYDAAAVVLYRRLAIRLRNPGFAFRASPELALLADQPQALNLQIGELEQKRGRYREALEVLEPAAAADRSNFDLQERIVRLLILLGRQEQAGSRAAELAVERQADAESLGLLREVSAARNDVLGVADELGALYRAHPALRSLVYAQADELRALNRISEAERILAAAARSFPDDFEIMRRRFDLLESSGDRRAAARFLIESVADHPDWSGQSATLFSELIRPASPRWLRLATLQKLDVAKSAEASKLFWVSRVASFWHHDGAARQSLEQAVRTRPVFPPAWPELLDRISIDPDLTESQKQEAQAKLASDARMAGNASLAAELEGLALLRRDRPEQAAGRFAEAVKFGGRSSDLFVAQATALRMEGDRAGFESTLWRAVSDQPASPQAYIELYGHYAARGADAQASRVLSTWLANDAGSIDARRVQAREYFRAGRQAAAEAILLRLYKEHPDDPDVIESLGELYRLTARTDEFISTMQARLDRDPENFAIMTELEEVYEAEHRTADASRILSGARSAADDDADLLYRLAAMYGRIGRKQVSEDALRRVLLLDPAHAGANNDLGYFLSEEGKDLTEAEVLVRRAIASDPHNASFLDSLGWVLYKRGRFDEARRYLAKAANSGPEPDPVVLDHLGDALYRLGDHEGASRNWEHASDRLQKLTDAGAESDEAQSLRAQLNSKRRQMHDHDPVDVSPVSEYPKNRSAVK